MDEPRCAPCGVTIFSAEEARQLHGCAHRVCLGCLRGLALKAATGGSVSKDAGVTPRPRCPVKNCKNDEWLTPAAARELLPHVRCVAPSCERPLPPRRHCASRCPPGRAGRLRALAGGLPGRAARQGEKDATLAQKLGQLQPFIALFPQECTGQLASFRPT